MNKLPAGKYWIGDPCYVLDDDNGDFDWGTFCRFCFQGDSSGRKNEGIVTHQGITFAYFGTAYGDGAYVDQEGNLYGVDAGMLGCIPIDHAGYCHLGDIHDFPEPFSCNYNNGTITFGHIVIKTKTG